MDSQAQSSLSPAFKVLLEYMHVTLERVAAQIKPDNRLTLLMQFDGKIDAFLDLYFRHSTIDGHDQRSTTRERADFLEYREEVLLSSHMGRHSRGRAELKIATVRCRLEIETRRWGLFDQESFQDISRCFSQCGRRGDERVDGRKEGEESREFSENGIGLESREAGRDSSLNVWRGTEVGCEATQSLEGNGTMKMGV